MAQEIADTANTNPLGETRENDFRKCSSRPLAIPAGKEELGQSAATLLVRVTDVRATTPGVAHFVRGEKS